MSKNDITGDTIKTKPNSRTYRDNWEKIFGDKKSNEKEKQKSHTKEIPRR